MFWNFRRLKIRSFFQPESWWKYDIYWLQKISCSELFRDGKYGPFLSQNVDGKIIFTDYWKVLVLNFSEIGNTVFFWAKKLIERWYLLITENLLFWTLWEWEIWSFFEPKSWWKDDIYYDFLSFPGLGKYGCSCSECNWILTIIANWEIANKATVKCDFCNSLVIAVNFWYQVFFWIVFGYIHMWQRQY